MTSDELSRLALVRRAKAAKIASGKFAELTPAELDLIVPAVPCARTRQLQKQGGRPARGDRP